MGAVIGKLFREKRAAGRAFSWAAAQQFLFLPLRGRGRRRFLKIYFFAPRVIIAFFAAVEGWNFSAEKDFYCSCCCYRFAPPPRAQTEIWILPASCQGCFLNYKTSTLHCDNFIFVQFRQ